jgi:hypothetical protein
MTRWGRACIKVMRPTHGKGNPDPCDFSSAVPGEVREGDL